MQNGIIINKLKMNELIKLDIENGEDVAPAVSTPSVSSEETKKMKVLETWIIPKELGEISLESLQLSYELSNALESKSKEVLSELKDIERDLGKLVQKSKKSELLGKEGIRSNVRAHIEQRLCQSYKEMLVSLLKEETSRYIASGKSRRSVKYALNNVVVLLSSLAKTRSIFL